MGKTINQLEKKHDYAEICLFGVDAKDHLDNSPTANSSVISNYKENPQGYRKISTENYYILAPFERNFISKYKSVYIFIFILWIN